MTPPWTGSTACASRTMPCTCALRAGWAKLAGPARIRRTTSSGRTCCWAAPWIRDAVWDIIAAARYLHAKYNGAVPVHVCGEHGAAVLAAYAALWEPEIAGVTAIDPPASHMDAGAPQLLNVLRVCDIPDAFGMLAPRPLTIRGQADAWEKVARIYAAAGARDTAAHRNRRLLRRSGGASPTLRDVHTSMNRHVVLSGRFLLCRANSLVYHGRTTAS